MRNIAITMGISEYQNAENLPACKNDVELITRLLKTSGKYEVLQVDETLSKHQIIKTIDSFLLQENTDQNIGEMLFYFSGHGFQDDEAHFILKDTSIERINSTALNNSEIDDIARKCNPELFVKIIDACQSGLTYIKGVSGTLDDLNIMPGSSSKSLKNCIFMCSSKKDQSSMATKEYSFFTKAFVSAALESVKSEVVRYADIQNYIIDAFSSFGNLQTPFFVMQSDGRDVFVEPTAEMKQLAEEFVNVELQSSNTKSEIEEDIDKFLESYRDEAMVNEIMQNIKTSMSSLDFNSAWITKYYNCSLTSSGYENHQEDREIVDFLYKKRNNENLYIEFDTERVREETIFGFPSFKTHPTSFTSLARKLPSVFSYHLTPKKDGLPKYETLFAFVYSDTHMYVFNTTKQFVCKGWNNFVRNEMTKYTYKTINYFSFEQTEWDSYITKQLKDSVEFIEKTILSFIS